MNASMAEMPLIAPLFIENGQLSTTVAIVSAMARATTVDVVLLDQTGAQITQQTYALDGHAQLMVKVSDLLQAANSGVFLGSVKVETDAEAQMNMAVLAQVSIAGTARGAPVYLEEEFPMAQPSDSGVFRAVAPAVLGFPVLALRSTSTSWQTVTESCFYERGGAAQSAVRLAPGAVVLSGACVAGGEQLASINAGWNQQTLDSKGAAGISVTSTGGVGALCVYGFALSGKAASPIYTALNFTDAGAVGSGNTVFAGVPVGQAGPLGSDVFAPALALTNFGTTPVKATLSPSRRPRPVRPPKRPRKPRSRSLRAFARAARPPPSWQCCSGPRVPPSPRSCKPPPGRPTASAGSSAAPWARRWGLG
ncbi:MAG: hypothetical protein WB579_20710 [Bryobacteraceae bacterium]